MSIVNLLPQLLAPNQRSLNPLESAKGFAADIMKRTGFAKEIEALKENSPELSASMSQRVADMEKSLESTIQYLTQNHGAGAATAAMGIIYKNLGDAPITEGTLGQAFLDVTKFIDANFGFSQGDNFINHLNGNLNESMNALFQNGQTEMFIAVTTINGKTHSTADGALSSANSKSLSETISDALTSVDEFTEKILQEMQNKRVEPEKGTAAHLYGPASSLPTGVLLNSSV